VAYRRHRWWRGGAVALGTLVATTATLGLGAASAGAGTTFLGGRSTITTVASTVPHSAVQGRGDVNPYGVAVVPTTVGKLAQGSVLVSNFNNRGNDQGTGKTIVEITPGGRRTLFSSVSLGAGQSCPGGVGLTTALAVFRSGWVVVGSLPTTNGMSPTAQAGCLIVLDADGHVVRTITGDPINGPWDMASLDFGSVGELFVTNVLNGTVAADPDPSVPGNVVDGGTVVRLVLDLDGATPTVLDETVIATGFGERTDPGALVVGPTGVALSQDGTLDVADTVGNRITAVPGASALPAPVFGTGFQVTSGGSLNGPLGLTIAPNGDIVTVNAGDGNAVETTPSGRQVVTRALDTTPVMGSPNGAGTLFGLAVAPNGGSLYFVDDGSNTLNRLS
jgi:sugar lactone lactonase YvrE